MKRWNGWGEETKTFNLPSQALKFLQDQIGQGDLSPDIDLLTALQSVPPSRISGQQAFITDNMTRLLHSRGQSLPDWIALRSITPDTYPDAVAFPKNSMMYSLYVPGAIKTVSPFSEKRMACCIRA